jgi:hypothetical protein
MKAADTDCTYAMIFLVTEQRFVTNQQKELEFAKAINPNAFYT